jgi:serine/threonine-protein kinase PpkA
MGGVLHGIPSHVIEIPGYRLLRQLGRGGMATVYLAVQESVDREVALKVMSPALLVDPNFGERFLREAKIAARLHHRHVVGIHDVGRVGDYHYIAMEHLSGGPILGKEGIARPVPFALRVIREISTAINYAQQKGVIHRDIKPDNILLRDDGSAALSDFGIARVSDSATRMTRTGAVVGTPHYMSPEQARGKEVDGRSDLYGLGVVLYEMLVGHVPYNADDSLAVGIMHITQPVPRLPESLAVLQPLVDGMLAKEPKDRFQTGNEVAQAIERYEQAIAIGDLQQLAAAPASIRRDARSFDTQVSPVPMAAARGTSGDSASRHRSDPSIGRLEEIIAATSGRPSSANRREASRKEKSPLRTIPWIPGVIAVLFLGAAFFAWRHQDRLRAYLPSTELNSMLARAQRALDAGNLTGTADSAQSLFQSARSIDPDNDIARRGLAEVGEQLIRQARESLDRNDLASAKRLAAAARELLGGGAAVDQISARIAEVEARGTQAEALLESAQNALAAQHLSGEDGAIALFQKMLASDPDNAVAKAGIRRSSDALKALALTALQSDDATSAAAHIEDIARILPTYPDLPDLRAQLAKQRDTAAATIDRDLARAEAQLRAGRIVGSSDSAQTLFATVLQRDPSNVRALTGMRAVGRAMLAQAQAAIEDSNPGAADRWLTQAEALNAEVADVRAARLQVRELRERLAIAAERQVTSPADLDRMQKLIADAALAVEAGRLIEPPGNSAYDKYRAALSIDGNNQAAAEGLARMPARARQLFDELLTQGAYSRARGMIDAVEQLSPSDASIASMRSRLATAYLNLAEKDIGENALADAQRAITSARALSPENSRLAALEQKLREASAAKP